MCNRLTATTPRKHRFCARSAQESSPLTCRYSQEISSRIVVVFAISASAIAAAPAAPLSTSVMMAVFNRSSSSSLTTEINTSDGRVHGHRRESRHPNWGPFETIEPPDRFNRVITVFNLALRRAPTHPQRRFCTLPPPRATRHGQTFEKFTGGRARGCGAHLLQTQY